MPLMRPNYILMDSLSDMLLAGTNNREHHSLNPGTSLKYGCQALARQVAAKADFFMKAAAKRQNTTGLPVDE